MTRLFQAGFETGDVTQIGAVSNSGFGGVGTVTVVSATPTARSGSYCLKCGLAGATATTIGGSRLTVTHASKTELYAAVGLYRHNAADTLTAPGTAFLQLNDTAGNANTYLFCEADGTVRAYYASAGLTGPTSAQLTLIGTSTINVPLDAWTLVEVRAVAATGATGTLEVRINGATGLLATSQRTCQVNANYGATVLAFLRFQASAAAASWFAFDDLRVNDTSGARNTAWPGDESIRLLLPTGAGDATQLARGGTDSGANWSQTDEIPPNGTGDYVSSDTVGQQDLYNLSTIAATAFSAVEVIIQGFNSGGGGSVNLSVKTAAGQSDGSAQALTATPTIYKRLLEVDPTSGLPFDQVAIDALQAGIRVAS